MIYGNYTALITPMTKSKKVDFDSLDKLLNIQINSNSNLVVFGSTAETSLLSFEEKNAILERITSKKDIKTSIIVGINAFSVLDAKKQITFYSNGFQSKIAAFLVAVPPYIRPSDEGVERFFLSVAEFSSLPIILYNVPSRTGKGISLETIKKLSKHKNIIGIKEASGDMVYASKIASLCDNNFCLICGNDNLLLPFLSIGSRAIISVIGNLMPNHINKIIDMFDISASEAYKLYFEIENLISLLSRESNPIMIKYLLSKLDLCKPFLREPLCLPCRKNREETNKQIDIFRQKSNFDAIL